MYGNAFESKNDNAFLNKLEEEKPKKSYLGRLGLGFIGLVALVDFAYEHTRPTMSAEIISTELSNARNSRMIVLNYETNKKDTIYIKTMNTGPKIVLGKPESFEGRAKELEEKLKSGLAIDMKLYNKNNELYKINQITNKNELEYLAKH